MVVRVAFRAPQHGRGPLCFPQLPQPYHIRHLHAIRIFVKYRGMEKIKTPHLSALCSREGCERHGQALRWHHREVLGTKSTEGRKTVNIHVFICESMRPQRTLHTEKRGPHGEPVEHLGFAHYRYRDERTGAILETQRRSGVEHKMSKAGLAAIRSARHAHWSDAAKKKQTSANISAAVSHAWTIPEKRERMTAAIQRRSASKAYRRKMSRAQIAALKDPEKKRRRSEGPRNARLAEQAILRAHKAAAEAKAKEEVATRRKSYSPEEIAQAIQIVRRVPYVTNRTARQALNISEAGLYRLLDYGKLKRFRKGYVYSLQVVEILDRAHAKA
jgi:hypothetical protein